MAKQKIFKIPKLKDDAMNHSQIIRQERKLTSHEVAEYGAELAKEELQLDQVRKEKKEADASFTSTIKEHLGNIMKLSQAIDTGILTEEVPCTIVLLRDKEIKYCYPENGSSAFQLPMAPEDYDLLT